MYETSTSAAVSGTGVGELLQIFLDGRGRTKSELAVLTGLSRNTVSARVDALLAAQLLVPAGSEASSGGRPPAKIAFNSDAGAVLAVDLGATHATVAVTNLAAEVLELHSEELAIADGPRPVLDRVFEVGEQLLSRHAAHRRLVGVGIGVPGPVEFATGRPINPPIMPGWDQFDVAGYTQQRFPGPVLVDNDVNILALGEQNLSWPDVDELIFVKVATGIGAGIITGGALQRGAKGVAGDIGHVQVPYSRDSPRPADDERSLAHLASGPAIAAELRTRGILAEGSRDVVRLVHENDPVAVEALRQAGRHVGEVLAMLVNTLNPSVIVIGGSVARAGEHLLAGIREVVYRKSRPVATQDLLIVPARAGDQGGVRGAATLVRQRVLSPENVEALVAGLV
ncbi:ROK family protein [Microbacterium sp. E-13]|uniref:ROK family protein n=1 Tax=Microbacterium sp. E-13 TaxID=3404048 RepID=UPI003CF69CD5